MIQSRPPQWPDRDKVSPTEHGLVPRQISMPPPAPDQPTIASSADPCLLIHRREPFWHRWWRLINGAHHAE